MANRNLPTRQELIEQGYPFGKATEGIPLGNRKTEWQRSNPDIVVYIPKQDRYDNDNEHFCVFKSPAYDGMMALWTQSSCEGHGDNHLVFAKSDKSLKNWDNQKVIAGVSSDGIGTQASWGFPIVSKSGRIYVFFTKEFEDRNVEGYDIRNRQHCGSMGCCYSEDNGETWIQSNCDIKPRRHKFDHPNPLVPTNWIVWQVPIRDANNKHLAGYTLWSNSNLRKRDDVGGCWINDDSRCYFMRFENIDEDPRPENIKITWLPEDENGIEVPNTNVPDIMTAQEPSVVTLPDGRLLTVMRTVTGYIWYSVSSDNASTWTKPQPLLYHEGGEKIPHPMSPCPIYSIGENKYILLFHNNNGNHLGFKQEGVYWPINYANFFRNPSYISVAEYAPNDNQPLRFGKPVEILNTDDIAVGPKKTAEIATYTTITHANGKIVLWYPDRKYYLLGKYIDDGIIK